MKPKLDSSLLKRALKKKDQVYIISGTYKNKTYTIERIMKNGYVYLKDLELINSRKKIYSVKVHHSNLSKKR